MTDVEIRPQSSGIRGGAARSWRKVAMGGLVVLAAAAVASPPSAAASTQPDTSNSKTATAQVLCLNVEAEKFVHRERPGHCNFYDGRAPGRRIIDSADFPTSHVRWSRWAGWGAAGRGRYHVSGRWLPVRLRLSRPRIACGHRVFTKIRLNLKTCGGRWTGWAEAVRIESCGPNL